MADEKVVVSQNSLMQGVTEYRNAFWGEGGVDTLYYFAKQANNSTKELEGYIRDRAKAEEGLGKELQKIAKHNGQVGQHVGVFAPAWVELILDSSEKHAACHINLSNQLTELAKEVASYHTSQREQYRLTKEQAIGPCTEAQNALEQSTGSALKCKKAYHEAHHQWVDLCEQHAKLQRESHKAKELEKLEARIKKAEANSNQSESDYKAALQKQETSHQDFRAKMVVMCDRLQKVERDHLAMMRKFLFTMFELDRKMADTTAVVKKHQLKGEKLTEDILLQQFIAVKGCGSVFVEPLKFQSPGEAPSLPANTSNVDLAAVVASDVAAQQAKKKWLRKKKKNEKAGKSKSASDDKEDTTSQAASEANVDEEGYTIRPNDADRLGTKEEKDSDFSSDGDSDRETESKLRSISIRPVEQSGSQSKLDNSTDLTAAVQNLSLLKPPTSSKTSSGESSTTRSAPVARSILDDDSDMPASKPNNILEFGMMSMTPLSAQNSTGTLSSAGAVTPPTSTMEPSGILKPVVSGPGATPPLSSSPAHFTADSPRAGSPAMRTMTAPSASPARTSNSSIPIYALFNETVNALFKGADISDTLVKVTGELQLSFPAASVGLITPTTAPLVIKLHPKSCVEQSHANTHLLESDPAATPGDHVLYRFKMAALQTFLKSQHDLAPTSAFYKVDIFKYQARVSSPIALPIHVNCVWKCEESLSNLKVGYTYNPQCRLNPAPVKFVSFITPVENISNLQSNPTAQHANGRLTWKVPEIAPGSGAGNLLAKIDLKSGPGKPTPVAVQFSLEGQSLSGFQLELASSAYQLVLLKHRLVTGKYMAEPAVVADVNSSSC